MKADKNAGRIFHNDLLEHGSAVLRRSAWLRRSVDERLDDADQARGVADD
jgi:hypothetical protein